MIRIRVKAVDKLLPVYLYHTLTQLQTQQQAVKIDEIRGINCRCTDSEDTCALTDLCDIVELDDDNSNVSLERGDISIDDNNQVRIFE